MRCIRVYNVTLPVSFRPHLHILEARTSENTQKGTLSSELLPIEETPTPGKEEPTMTDATPPLEEKKEGQPRDAAYWAKRVERLEVSEVPAGAAHVHAQGRKEVGGPQGLGPH